MLFFLVVLASLSRDAVLNEAHRFAASAQAHAVEYYRREQLAMLAWTLPRRPNCALSASCSLASSGLARSTSCRRRSSPTDSPQLWRLRAAERVQFGARAAAAGRVPARRPNSRLAGPMLGAQSSARVGPKATGMKDAFNRHPADTVQSVCIARNEPRHEACDYRRARCVRVVGRAPGSTRCRSDDTAASGRGTRSPTTTCRRSGN